MTFLQDTESPAFIGEQPVGLTPYLWTYAALWLVSAVALVLFTNSYFPTADPVLFGVLPVVSATTAAIRFSSRERRPMTPSERVKFSICGAACAVAVSLILAALALVFDSPREASAFNTWVLPLMTALLVLPPFLLNYLAIYSVEIVLWLRTGARTSGSLRAFVRTVIRRRFPRRPPRHERPPEGGGRSFLGFGRGEPRVQAVTLQTSQSAAGLAPSGAPLFWSPPPPPSDEIWPPEEYDGPSIDIDPYLRMYTKYLYRSGVAVTVTLITGLLSFGWFDLKPNAAKVAGIIAVVAALPAIAVARAFLRNEERAMTRNERLGLSNSRPWRAGVIGTAISIMAQLASERAVPSWAPYGWIHVNYFAAYFSTLGTTFLVQGTWQLRNAIRERWAR